jgi:argininosuccinate lyase
VPRKDICHTHEGSIGKLCNDRIKQMMDATLSRFTFDRMDRAEKQLLEQ